MATGDEKRNGRLRDVAVHEPVDGHVCGEMVDAIEGAVERERKAFGCAYADEKCADEAGAGGDSDRVHIAQRDAGFRGRPVEGRIKGLEVSPTGNLRHHSPEARMLVDAGRHRIGEEGPAADEGDARLIA